MIVERFFGLMSAALVLVAFCSKDNDRAFPLTVAVIFAVWQNTMVLREKKSLPSKD